MASLPTEERAEAGGGADSAAARQPTASGNIFDSIRPPFPMEERAEADGGADSAAARRLAASGNTFDRRQQPYQRRSGKRPAAGGLKRLG